MITFTRVYFRKFQKCNFINNVYIILWPTFAVTPPWIPPLTIICAILQACWRQPQINPSLPVCYTWCYWCVFQDGSLLKSDSDNKADTVLQLFGEAVRKYNLPSRVRSDLGLENISWQELRESNANQNTTRNSLTTICLALKLRNQF